MDTDALDFLTQFSPEALHAEFGLPLQDNPTPRTIVDQDDLVLSTGRGNASSRRPGAWLYKPVPQDTPDILEREPIFLRHPDGTRDRVIGIHRCPDSAFGVHYHLTAETP